jgi:hypothetical protein
MPAEDNRSGAEAGLGKPPADHYSLDTLAKGLASDSVSRGQALRMMGSALAGAALALFVPGVARAQQDGPVNHGPNGPVNGGATGTCSGSICSKDSDCGGGCSCSCHQNIHNFPTPVCC